MTPKSVAIAVSVLSIAGAAAGAQSRTGSTSRASAKPAPANLHLVVASTGNEARYRVREQLITINFPSDAVGKTSQISGMLVVDPNGTIISDSSKIVVNVQSLKSDHASRDKTIRETSLESNKYPLVTFVPTSFVGLTAKPGATAATFSMVGNLTVHGTTHPVTWTVTAHSQGDDVVGTALTKFSFEDFGIAPPKKAVLLVPLSVADTVKLEYDFHFAPAALVAKQ
ncbi:MAG TPA: YceI family protein [Gemmatimonadaceae bacterium]|jgi:polyisoprenoid-binding protein YceI